MYIYTHMYIYTYTYEVRYIFYVALFYRTKIGDSIYCIRSTLYNFEACVTVLISISVLLNIIYSILSPRKIFTLGQLHYRLIISIF